MTEKGMTLMEVLFTIALSSLFFVVMLPLFINSTHMISEIEMSKRERDRIQTAIYCITDELRNARGVGIWVQEEGREGIAPIEIYHNPEKLVEDKIYHLKRINLAILDPIINNTPRFQVSKIGKSTYLSYEYQTLVEGFEAIEVERFGKDLLFSFKIKEEDSEYEIRTYPFIIEHSYKQNITKY